MANFSLSLGNLVHSFLFGREAVDQMTFIAQYPHPIVPGDAELTTLHSPDQIVADANFFGCPVHCVNPRAFSFQLRGFMIGILLPTLPRFQTSAWVEYSPTDQISIGRFSIFNRSIYFIDAKANQHLGRGASRMRINRFDPIKAVVAVEIHIAFAAHSLDVQSWEFFFDCLVYRCKIGHFVLLRVVSFDAYSLNPNSN
jgi:hypothetical protein